MWVIIGTVILLSLMIFWGSSVQKGEATSNDDKGSQLQASESSYDFGSISMAQGKVTKVFSFKNNTSEAIKAKKLYTSCMCTKATLIKTDQTLGPFGMPAHGFIPEINVNIEPGEEAKIETVFDPAAHGPAGVGPIAREVILETSDGKLIFKFNAQVTP